MEFTPNKKKSYYYKLYGNKQAADLLGIVRVGVSDGEHELRILSQAF